MKVKYKVEKLLDRVYHCTIKDEYDLAMTFCRVQEFYESPFKQIRNKSFEILDFIKIYTQWGREGAFTYPTDWVGFNIPSNIIKNMFRKGIKDYNHYDDIIASIDNSIKDDHYYLIASSGNDKSTLNHELCHALYFLDKEYKCLTNKIIKQLLPSVYKKIECCLLKTGYCKNVIKDEIQAYLTTEELDNIKLNKRELKNLVAVKNDLQKYFKLYKRNNKIKL